jgi:hypothetical protein
MHRLPRLGEEDAQAIATRLTQVLGQLGSPASVIHLQEVMAGLLVMARVGERDGTCLIPHGHTVEWTALAQSIVDESTRNNK